MGRDRPAQRRVAERQVAAPFSQLPDVDRGPGAGLRLPDGRARYLVAAEQVDRVRRVLAEPAEQLRRGEPFLCGDGFARIGEGSGSTNMLTGSGVDEAWTTGIQLAGAGGLHSTEN